jgi:hypothetical protein
MIFYVIVVYFLITLLMNKFTSIVIPTRFLVHPLHKTLLAPWGCCVHALAHPLFCGIMAWNPCQLLKQNWYNLHSNIYVLRIIINNQNLDENRLISKNNCNIINLKCPNCFDKRWQIILGLDLVLVTLHGRFSGTSHYGQRSRGCRFSPIILQETKSLASQPFTLRPKSKGCRNLEWLLFEGDNGLSKEV